MSVPRRGDLPVGGTSASAWRGRADDTAAEAVAGHVLRGSPGLGPVRLVTIDGPSGSGKSTFAARVLARLRARGVATVLVPTDDFATWEEPVRWWPRLRSGVLEPLSRGRPGRYRRVEWPEGVPVTGGTVEVPVPDVLVLEGVSSGRAELAGRVTTAVWTELADAATRLARAVARDGVDSRAELLRWQEFERHWFEVDRTGQRADFVVTPAG
ncbi:uridine kinase family protein [Actinopolyspora mortivallis]|uniref:uridine kinase family protein n=1 Tax=Actinopolyspora mortivallis TaxID=33906 RepID=UPI0003647B07|nr:hypothetical protein [Actinopolyspora mortivallis]